MKSKKLLEITGLYKKYANKTEYTITDINMCGNEGEIVGILGHNGAGKSTTIKCITGMHPFDKGDIVINGHSILTDSIEAKKDFGYVSDEFALFEKMTGFEYVNFLADIYQVSVEEREKRIEEFQKLFALGDAIYKQISSYSHGMKQKISIMGALIHNPKVFILDEPMTGLDPHTANQLKNFFIEHSRKNNLVLFSSHNLDVVEKLCDRLYIIDQGVVLEEIDLKDFRKKGLDLEDYFLSSTNKVSK
ncbi:MAG: ABC transporter ATP-binding protein [Clostridia bacterium]|nr:ABC transporter ATP-binding protein [Clostridia bacterium]